MVSNQNGQAVTEYIVMLVFVISAYMLVAGGIFKLKLGERLMRPLKQEFASTYRYGKAKAKGFDDGGPENHPRARNANGFRIFLNPSQP